jgi:transcriptional regulator with XRE-family HTH domain
MTFGERLKELRESAGLTQEALSQTAGVPVGSVRNYEQGHRIPSFGAIVRLAEALGTDCRAFSACTDIAEEPPAKAKPGRPKKAK